MLLAAKAFAATYDGTVDEKEILRLARHRAVIQEQKFRLQEDLAKKNQELEKMKILISGDRKDVFQALGFLKYVKSHANHMIFQGIEYSSSLDRRQRLLEEITGHQLQLIEQKVKALKQIELTQKLVLQRLEQISARDLRLAELESQITETYRKRDKFLSKTGTMPSLRGKLDWPLEFRDKKKFGINTASNSHLVYRTNGVYLSANTGQPVKVVNSGEVAFTGLLDGFGPTVIVDHGDHFYSVYSGLKDLVVQTGDKVIPRQKIGSSALVKNFELPGIYFELRHYRDAIDPEPWMKGIIR